MLEKSKIGRRGFLSNAAIVGATGALGAGGLLSSCSGSSRLSAKKETDSLEKQLIGVWKNVSPRFRGEMIKFISKDYFVWTWSIENNVVVHSAGGVYIFDGETYTETLKYGTATQQRYVGQQAVVKVRFEYNKFYSTGHLAGMMLLNEVWERIE